MGSDHIVIIGAGPAGLTAAYTLAKAGKRVTVLEMDSSYVGGISRTVHYKGFSFDIGGHRFFSKSKVIEDLWTEILPDDMLERPRSSRIHYDGKFYAYPLKAWETLKNLGPIEAGLCVLSYLWARLKPVKDPKSFEEWVSNHFGRRLFRTFFKTYTEKVWGMPCSEISADWAAQRIKGLSLSKAIWNSLRRTEQNKANPHQVIKTLINSFRYPRRGPGMLWEACAEKAKARGAVIRLGAKVTRCEWSQVRQDWTVAVASSDGPQEFVASHVIASAPLSELIAGLEPEPDHRVLEAARSLRYRDFLTVALVLKERNVFSDNWLYIHDPDVKVGRIQNFKSWSPEMVPGPELTCYGLEYFCFEGDGLWSRSDGELIDFAKRELIQLGLAAAEDVLDGCVVRQPKAYPVYDEFYRDNVNIIRSELEKKYPGLYPVGRNGMHKYNNQDHAMMTALLASENIINGRIVYDIWKVNEDAEYHEQARPEHLQGAGRLIPTRLERNE